MKYLILFLLSFNSYAEIKVDITGLLSGEIYGDTFKTQQEADSWVNEAIAVDIWGKKERWEVYSDQTTCLVIEDVMNEVPDVTILYPEVIPDGYQHPTVMIVAYQRCRMPVEYTILSCDTDMIYELGHDCKATVDDFKAKKDKKNRDIADLDTIYIAIKNGSAKLEDVVLYIKIKEGL